MPAKGTRKKKEVKPIEPQHGGFVSDPASIENPPPPLPAEKVYETKQAGVEMHLTFTREDYRAISDSTEGWLEPEEADLLVKVAAERASAAEENVWVEDGSFHGRTTVLLAGELALFGEGTLYAIDPHNGDLSFPTHYEDGLLASNRTDNVGTTIDAFRATIERAQLGQFVQEVITNFQNFSVDHGTVTLAFMDGLHDHDSVKADWEHLKPMLHDQAIVMFHDYQKWHGPTLVVDTAIVLDEVQFVEQAGSLVVLRYMGAK